MLLEDLNDDVLRVVIKYIEDFNQLRLFSCTSRRLYNLARHCLMRRRYSIFRIGHVHIFRPPLDIVGDLLGLLSIPTRANCISRISTYLDPNEFSSSSDFATEHMCNQIYHLLVDFTYLSPQVKTILHILESDLAHLTNKLSWVRMCMNIVFDVMWLCPNVRELRLRGCSYAGVVDQMQCIGSRIYLEPYRRLISGKPEPYDQLDRLLKIRRLELGRFSCRLMHLKPEAFKLLLIPSLRRLETEGLDTTQWQYDHFWPVRCKHNCAVTDLVIEFYQELPSPLVISDFLSRCPSLERFELRKSSSAGSCDISETHVEEVDSYANTALHKISRPEVKGLPGYADLIRSSLGDAFEEMRYRLNCFVPCDDHKRQRLDPRCEVVVVSITRE